jgi:hypothetical protein
VQSVSSNFKGGRMEDLMTIMFSEEIDKSRDNDSEHNVIIMKYLDLMDDPTDNDNFGLIAELYGLSSEFWDRMLEFQEKNIVSCWEVCTSDEFVKGLSKDDLGKLVRFQGNMANLFEVSFEPLFLRVTAILKVMEIRVNVKKDFDDIISFLLSRVPIKLVWDFVDEHLKKEMRENRLVQTV